MIYTAIRWSLVLVLCAGLLLIPSPHLKASTLGAVVSAVNALSGSFDVAAVVAAVNAVRVLNNQKIGEHINKLVEQAQGRIDPLTQSLTDLSSAPTQLVDNSVSWASDFQTPEVLTLVQELTDLQAAGKDLTAHWRGSLATADTIGETEIAALFSDPLQANVALEGWRTQREAAERQLAIDYAALDAAEELAERLAVAQTSLATLRTLDPQSGTALQEAQLAADLTESELAVAQQQLLAYQAIREAQEQQAQQLAHREAVGRWHTAELAAHTQNDASINWIQTNATTMGQALLLPQRYGTR